MLLFFQLFRYAPRAQICNERIFFWRISAGKLQVAIHWTHTRCDIASVLQNKISRANESTENTMLKIFLANKSFVLHEKSIFHQAVIFFATANLSRGDFLIITIQVKNFVIQIFVSRRFHFFFKLGMSNRKFINLCSPNSLFKYCELQTFVCNSQ